MWIENSYSDSDVYQVGVLYFQRDVNESSIPYMTFSSFTAHLINKILFYI